MAMNGRQYSVAYAGVTLAAAQDLLALYAGVKVLGIQRIELGALSTSIANFRMRLRLLTATVTAGSGGSTPTPRAVVADDAAATATAHANDTTQATSGGSAIDLWDVVWNSVNGYFWEAPAGRPLIIPPSGAFVLSLDTAPASLVSNGSVLFEELP
jgi:hypothetical protein